MKFIRKKCKILYFNNHLQNTAWEQQFFRGCGSCKRSDRNTDMHQQSGR